MARSVAERADVVPVLAEVFRRHGFEGASIGLIVEATGLGRGSLYHFFPAGKADMAAAVLAHVSAWFETNIFEPLETRPPVEAIPAMFEAVTAYFEAGRRICLVGAFALDDTRDRFAAAIEGYFRRWLEALGGCLARAGWPPEAAARMANEAVAGIHGGIVLARATGEPERFRVVLARLGGACTGPAPAGGA
ncbi:TetR/AcrR family transcriptional regulator [Rhodobacteraceae bacterium DSL-40]|uniref:TetR/AcrR family transcriptional regulator n=1 Tax=Amaricoccus sp. B4 TaxID=3368557 RepID=UPI000DAD490A